MNKPNRFLLYLGAVVLIAMVAVAIWAIFAKTKFLTVVLVVLALLLAVSGITSLVISFRDKQ